MTDLLTHYGLLTWKYTIQFWNYSNNGQIRQGLLHTSKRHSQNACEWSTIWILTTRLNIATSEDLNTKYQNSYKLSKAAL